MSSAFQWCTEADGVVTTRDDLEKRSRAEFDFQVKNKLARPRWKLQKDAHQRWVGTAVPGQGPVQHFIVQPAARSLPEPTLREFHLSCKRAFVCRPHKSYGFAPRCLGKNCNHDKFTSDGYHTRLVHDLPEPFLLIGEELICNKCRVRFITYHPEVLNQYPGFDFPVVMDYGSGHCYSKSLYALVEDAVCKRLPLEGLAEMVTRSYWLAYYSARSSYAEHIQWLQKHPFKCHLASEFPPFGDFEDPKGWAGEQLTGEALREAFLKFGSKRIMLQLLFLQAITGQIMKVDWCRALGAVIGKAAAFLMMNEFNQVYNAVIVESMESYKEVEAALLSVELRNNHYGKHIRVFFADNPRGAKRTAQAVFQHLGEGLPMDDDGVKGDMMHAMRLVLDTMPSSHSQKGAAARDLSNAFKEQINPLAKQEIVAARQRAGCTKEVSDDYFKQRIVFLIRDKMQLAHRIADWFFKYQALGVDAKSGESLISLATCHAVLNLLELVLDNRYSDPRDVNDLPMFSRKCTKDREEVLKPVHYWGSSSQVENANLWYQEALPNRCRPELLDSVLLSAVTQTNLNSGVTYLGHPDRGMYNVVAIKRLKDAEMSIKLPDPMPEIKFPDPPVAEAFGSGYLRQQHTASLAQLLSEVDARIQGLRGILPLSEQQHGGALLDKLDRIQGIIVQVAEANKERSLPQAIVPIYAVPALPTGVRLWDLAPCPSFLNGDQQRMYRDLLQAGCGVQNALELMGTICDEYTKGWLKYCEETGIDVTTGLPTPGSVAAVKFPHAVSMQHLDGVPQASVDGVCAVGDDETVRLGPSSDGGEVAVDVNPPVVVEPLSGTEELAVVVDTGAGNGNDSVEGPSTDVDKTLEIDAGQPSVATVDCMELESGPSTMQANTNPTPEVVSATEANINTIRHPLVPLINADAQPSTSRVHPFFMGGVADEPPTKKQRVDQVPRGQALRLNLPSGQQANLLDRSTFRPLWAGCGVTLPKLDVKNLLPVFDNSKGSGKGGKGGKRQCPDCGRLFGSTVPSAEHCCCCLKLALGYDNPGRCPGTKTCRCCICAYVVRCCKQA